MSTPLVSERHNLVGIAADVVNVTLTDANTEYVFTLPSYTRRFSLKTRNSQHIVKVSFAQGMSSSVYFTLENAAWNEDTILAVDLHVYCQSPNAGCVLEIVVWR